MRTTYLYGKGYKVLRFWNDQIFAEIDSVLSIIHASLSPTPLPPKINFGGRGDHQKRKY